jgi:hypothetical protein
MGQQVRRNFIPAFTFRDFDFIIGVFSSHNEINLFKQKSFMSRHLPGLYLLHICHL